MPIPANLSSQPPSNVLDNLNTKNLSTKSDAKNVADTLNTSLKKPKHFKQVCIIGLGLIGASLAQAIRDNELSERLIAVDSHLPSIEAALQANVIDAGSTQLDAVVAGSDCIVIAVPVKAVGFVFDAINQAMQQNLIQSNCIITDVCSTKQSVVDSAVEVFGILPKGFVPAHPIAGTENSGFHARVADLFVNRSVIVCEVESTCPDAVKKVKNLWSAVGAQVMTMDVAHHDTVLAHTSHLPHLLAFNLVNQLADNDDNMDIFRYAASGFREVEAETAMYGVVPVENSSEGVVNHTLDGFIASKLKIIGEVELPIHQNFLVAEHTKVDGLSRIYSHQQSLAQCRHWLDVNYPNVERVQVSSNGEAARRLQNEWHSAAIAGDVAVAEYGLHKLHENIEDNPGNTTRFLIIGHENIAPSGHDKTSILVAAEDKAGALLEILKPFSKYDVSLTSIETRPERPNKWAYVFFIDLNGHIEDDNVKAAIDELRPIVKEVRVLGSYPKAVI